MKPKTGPHPQAIILWLLVFGVWHMGVALEAVSIAAPLLCVFALVFCSSFLCTLFVTPLGIPSTIWAGDQTKHSPLPRLNHCSPVFRLNALPNDVFSEYDHGHWSSVIGFSLHYAPPNKTSICRQHALPLKGPQSYVITKLSSSFLVT